MERTVAVYDHELVISKREFDQVVRRIHERLPLDNPADPMWDLYLELVGLGERGR